VRAGGHNIAGNAVCDGGLLIDLSLMKSVRVDHTGPIAPIGWAVERNVRSECRKPLLTQIN